MTLLSAPQPRCQGEWTCATTVPRKREDHKVLSSPVRSWNVIVGNCAFLSAAFDGRALQIAGQETTRRNPPARTPQWPLLSSGHRASPVRPALGTGSTRSVFPRRSGCSFLRVLGATIFFGTDVQRRHAAVVNQARINFMSEARIWFSRDVDQENLPGVGQNVIVLSEEFYQEFVVTSRI